MLASCANHTIDQDIKRMPEGRRGLRKLFNNIAASTVFSGMLLTGAALPARGAELDPPAPVVSPVVSPAAPSAAQTPAADTGCPAFPGFHRPAAPMQRLTRDRTPDPALRAEQQNLRVLGIDGGWDGLMGNDVHAALDEYLLFYGPLYGAKLDHATLTDNDAAQ